MLTESERNAWQQSMEQLEDMIVHCTRQLLKLAEMHEHEAYVGFLYENQSVSVAIL